MKEENYHLSRNHLLFFVRVSDVNDFAVDDCRLQGNGEILHHSY